eukprot:c15645_g1_i2 orf=678-2435(-)
MASSSRETKQKQGLHGMSLVPSFTGKADSPYSKNHHYVYQNNYCHSIGHCRCSHAESFECVSDGHGSSSSLENGEVICYKSECFSNCRRGSSDDAFSPTESLSDGIGRSLTADDVLDGHIKHCSSGVLNVDGLRRLSIADCCNGISHDQVGSFSCDEIGKSLHTRGLDGVEKEKFLHTGSVDGAEKETQNCNGDLQNGHGSSFNPSSAGGVEKVMKICNGDPKDTHATTEVEIQKPAKRAFCKRCEKAQDLCICNRFKAVVQNTIKITILQNPKEKHHAVGSARVALLGLENVALIDAPEMYSKESFRIRPKVPGSKRSLAGRGGKKSLLKGGNSSMLAARDSGPSEAEVLQVKNLLNRLNASETSQCALHLNHNSQMVHCGGIPQGNLHDSMHLEGGAGVKDGIMHKSRPPEEKMGLYSRGVLCGEDSEEDNRVVDKRALSSEELEFLIPPGVALLYPSDKAIELSQPFHLMELHNEQELKTPCHLIVLDGTWSKARRIYFENPWLQSLPHYKLSLSSPSLYEGVRKQPKPGCLSTLESIVYALKVLEPDTGGLDGLLEVFDSMVEDQRRCKQMKCCLQEYGME